jgi:hypothetical protein
VPKAKTSPLIPLVTAFAMIAGLAGTVLCLMAVVGTLSDTLWVRLSAALIVALAVPAVIADRLLPETDPKPKGLVTAVFAVTWLGFVALFVFAARSQTKPMLLAEGDRLLADDWSAVGELSYLLAGGRTPTPTPDSSAVVAASADAVVTAPTASSIAELTPSAEPTASATAQPSATASATAVATNDPAPPPPRAQPSDCTYPAGPYGVDKGEVLSPTLSWQGFRPGSDEQVTILSRELFDCDGKGGIDAVVIDTSQFG